MQLTLSKTFKVHIFQSVLGPSFKYRTLHSQFSNVLYESVVGSSLFLDSGAVLVTPARLDHHHHPADDLAILAPKAHRRSLSPVRPAASPI